MEDIKKVAREYANAIDSVKHAREKLTKVIIKYIIANGHDPSKCTELAISEGLGLPRSAVRSVLLDLVDEYVLEVRDVGNIKPYVFTFVGIGAAMDWLDLSFTRDEVHELLSTKETDKFGGMFEGTGASDEVDGKRIERFRGVAANKCLEALIGRFLDYTDNKAYDKIKEAFGRQTLKELGLLTPETVSFEKVIETYPFPAMWMNRDLQYMDETASAEDVRRTVVKTYERDLKYAISRLRKFTSILEERGYEGMHASLMGKKPSHQVYEPGETVIDQNGVMVNGTRPPGDWRFNDAYLWATTLALRDGCKIGEKIGADATIIKEARELADVLDLALERRYRGVKAEGSTLMEWGLRQKSR